MRTKSILQCNPSALVAGLRPELDEAISRVLESGPYILGPEVEAFENEWAEWCGVEHAVGCANGTDSLELILRSLDLPVGSWIVAPSHTAVATIAAIVRAGHRPVLADVAKDSYCIDPASAARCIDSVEASGEVVGALIAVHLYGQPASLDSLQQLCGEHQIPLIEDGSQAHGARWRGQCVGGFGVAAGFSLYPTKNLGALGDAGVISCRDEQRAARLKRLRQYGWVQPAISEEPGLNSRLDPIQAAVLRVKLRALEAHNTNRRVLGKVYQSRLKDQPLVVLPPSDDELSKPVYHQFVIQLPNGIRDQVRQNLQMRGVGTLIHYPKAAHQMPAYHNKSWVRLDPNGLAVTDALLPRILSLPMGPHLSTEQVGDVSEILLQELERLA
jgi:dTDP-4-amino-4,6-dideoxygalactose transaminase